MPPPTNNPALSFVAGTAITKALLATIAAGVLDLCGATDLPLGCTMDTVDAGAQQGLRMFSAGTMTLTASGAITKLAPVYTDAGGKITATRVTGSHCIGVALEAAAADGDLIEVMPLAVLGQMVKSLAALTAAAANAGAINSGDATTDAVITSLRTQYTALLADVTAMRTQLIASGLFVAA
jgi:hypothetical protein